MVNACDFWCETCKEVWTYEKKERHHIFPSRHVECPKCGGKDTRRYWMNQIPIVNVKPGRLGNSKTGYANVGAEKDAKVQGMLKKIQSTDNPVFDTGDMFKKGPIQ